MEWHCEAIKFATFYIGSELSGGGWPRNLSHCLFTVKRNSESLFTVKKCPIFNTISEYIFQSSGGTYYSILKLTHFISFFQTGSKIMPYMFVVSHQSILIVGNFGHQCFWWTFYKCWKIRIWGSCARISTYLSSKCKITPREKFHGQF